MAEDFGDVVKKLGSSVKKPSAGKASAVLAVQMVDSKGKVIKEEKGAAAAEAQREEEKRGKKTITLLERIANAVTGGRGRPDGGKGGGLFGGMGIGAIGGALGLSAAAIGAALTKMIGPAALLAGLALAIKDGFAGYFKSEEWGVSKLAGTIGGLFGGMDKGLKGALWGGMKWALIGAGIGSVIPVIGTALGGAIGALLGALLGWIGGEKIAKWIDNMTIWLKEKWAGVTQWVKDVALAIKAWIIEKFDFAVGAVIEGWKGLKEYVAEKALAVKDWIVRKFTFASDAVIAGWNGLKEYVKEKALAVKDWIVRKFTFASDAVIAGWNGLKEYVATTALAVKDWIVRKFTFAVDAVIEKWNGLKAYVATTALAVKDWIVRKFTFAVDAVIEGWTGLKEYVKEKALAVKDWIVRKFTFASDAVIAGWKGLAEYVKEKALAVKDWIVRKFTFASDAVIAGWNGLSAKVKNVAEDVVAFFWNDKGTGLLNFKMPEISLKENWDKFTASIPQWIKDNIFDPGTAGDNTGAGSSMKIFGMEMKFPSLNISFTGMADKILSILPRWLTDPVAYITDIVSQMAKHIPFMGDDKPLDQEEIADIKRRIKKLKSDNAIDEKRNVNKRGRGRRQLRIDELEAKIVGQRQMGGPVKKDGLYNTHDDFGELYIPSSSDKLNAQRTQQMIRAGILRDMGGAAPGGGSSPVTSINTGGNVVTTSYVNNGIAARRPVVLGSNWSAGM